MMDKFGLKRREDAVTLGRSIYSYLNCCSESAGSFRDSETWYYTFQFPVFMFHEKLISGLKPAIDTLLGHTESDPHLDSPPGGVELKSFLTKLNLEIRWSGRKQKKWRPRMCILYGEELKVFKNDEAKDPLFCIKLANITRLVPFEDSGFGGSLTDSGAQSGHQLTLTFFTAEHLESVRFRVSLSACFHFQSSSC